MLLVYLLGPHIYEIYSSDINDMKVHENNG